MAKDFLTGEAQGRLQPEARAPPPPNGKMLPLMRYTANGRVIVERRLIVVEEEEISEALKTKLDSWMQRRGFESPAPSRGGSPVPT